MNEGALYGQVSTVFGEVWNEHIRQGGVGTITIKSKRGLPGGSVALLCPYVIGGVKFTDMVKNLYCGEVDEDEVVAAWDKASTLLRANASNLTWAVMREFRGALPDASFSAGGHAYYPCVQFLKLVSLKDGYSLTSTKEVCLLHTPSGHKLGIDRHSLHSSEEVTRTRRKIPDLREPMRVWRGRKINRPAHIRTSGAYLLLQQGVPEMGDIIDALFAVAMEGGEGVEEAIYKNLDIVVDIYKKDPPSIKYEGVALKAFEIINSAEVNPTPALRKLLSDHMGMLRFSKFFGSDYYTRGSKYTKSRRQKHLRALNRLIFLGFFESGDKKEKKEPVDVLLSTLFGI